MSSTEEEADCPICCNELDLTDRSIQYCSCGFQPCLWCYHHILEEATKENLPARCPNCRSEYDQNKISMQHIDAEQLEEEKRKLKEKDKPKGIGGPTSRIPRAALTNVRVVQPNLVYAVGISMEICHEDVLKDVEFFGQFGKTVKISVNRSNQYASAMARHGPTGSAYVTFKRAEDALRCIKMIDGNLWRGKPVKACFGTTKYCNAFLKGVPCNNPDCLYLHELADDADCLTKEEVAAGLLPARFLAMGATNTFKPRLTINLIPNAQTAAAQAAAAAAAAAGQPPAAIAAAAAAAGGISRAVPPATTTSGSSTSTTGPPLSYQQQQQQQFSHQQQQQQQPPPPPVGSAPRVLTIPISGRTASHGAMHHQQDISSTSGNHHTAVGGAGGGGSSSGYPNGGGYGGGANEMDSPGRSHLSSGYHSGYHHHHHPQQQQQQHHQHQHHNDLESNQEYPAPGLSPPRGLWASAAAAGANAGGVPMAPQQPAAAVPPPPPSDKQEWPTLASAPSNASSTAVNTSAATSAADREDSLGGRPGTEGLGRMPSMAEQLARAHSNPAEAKTARQPKKLVPLSSPGKLKTLGKAIQRPASPLDLNIYRPGTALNTTTNINNINTGVGASSSSNNSGLGVGAIGQGIVELNLGHNTGISTANNSNITSLGGVGGGGGGSHLLGSDIGSSLLKAAPPLGRGPPPGFGSSTSTGPGPSAGGLGSGLAPPGFSTGTGGGAGVIGGGSGHSSFDSSLGNLHHQQQQLGNTAGTGIVSNGSGPSTYSPFIGGSALFDPPTLGAITGSGGGGSGSGNGSQRQRSRFAFANAEEEAAGAHMHAMGNLGGTNLSTSSMMMPQQQQQQQSSMFQQQQHQSQNTHAGSPSPQDASAFFKSLFPTANINIAAVSPPPHESGATGGPQLTLPQQAQQAQRLTAPPGFSPSGGIGAPVGSGSVQNQHGYNPVSSMFPGEQGNGPTAAGSGGGGGAGDAGLAPGLALLRQLQGGKVSPHTSTGGGGGTSGGQQPPPGFGMRM